MLGWSLNACAANAARISPVCRALGPQPAYISSSSAAASPGGSNRSAAQARPLFLHLRSVLAVPPKTAAWRALVAVRRSLARASAGPGALVGEDGGKPYFAFDEGGSSALTTTAANKLFGHPRRRRFDGADARARRRHPRRPRRVREALRDGIDVLRITMHCWSSGWRCTAPPPRSRCNRTIRPIPNWARLRHGGDQLHRTGHLVRPQDRLSLARRRRSSNQTASRGGDAEPGAGQDSFIGSLMAKPANAPNRMQTQMKPPDCALCRTTPASCQSRARRSTSIVHGHGERGVDRLRRQSRKGPWGRGKPWIRLLSAAVSRWPTPPS